MFDDLTKALIAAPISDGVEYDDALAQLLKSDVDAALEWLLKGAGHKYLRRTPKPGGGYRYIYAVNSQHHDSKPEVGEKIRIDHEGKAGHYEVTAKHDDGHVTVRHDESGHEMKLHRNDLHDTFKKQHTDKINETLGKLASVHAQAQKTGTPKQIKRAKAALDEATKRLRTTDQTKRVAKEKTRQKRAAKTAEGKNEKGVERGRALLRTAQSRAVDAEKATENAEQFGKGHNKWNRDAADAHAVASLAFQTMQRHLETMPGEEKIAALAGKHAAEHKEKSDKHRETQETFGKKTLTPDEKREKGRTDQAVVAAARTKQLAHLQGKINKDPWPGDLRQFADKVGEWGKGPGWDALLGKIREEASEAESYGLSYPEKKSARERGRTLAIEAGAHIGHGTDPAAPKKPGKKPKRIPLRLVKPPKEKTPSPAAKREQAAAQAKVAAAPKAQKGAPRDPSAPVKVKAAHIKGRGDTGSPTQAKGHGAKWVTTGTSIIRRDHAHPDTLKRADEEHAKHKLEVPNVEGVMPKKTVEYKHIGSTTTTQTTGGPDKGKATKVHVYENAKGHAVVLDAGLDPPSTVHGAPASGTDFHSGAPTNMALGAMMDHPDAKEAKHVIMPRRDDEAVTKVRAQLKEQGVTTAADTQKTRKKADPQMRGEALSAVVGSGDPKEVTERYHVNAPGHDTQETHRAFVQRTDSWGEHNHKTAANVLRGAAKKHRKAGHNAAATAHEALADAHIAAKEQKNSHKHGNFGDARRQRENVADGLKRANQAVDKHFASGKYVSRVGERTGAGTQKRHEKSLPDDSDLHKSAVPYSPQSREESTMSKSLAPYATPDDYVAEGPRLHRPRETDVYIGGLPQQGTPPPQAPVVQLNKSDTEAQLLRNVDALLKSVFDEEVTRLTHLDRTGQLVASMTHPDAIATMHPQLQKSLGGIDPDLTVVAKKAGNVLSEGAANNPQMAEAITALGISERSLYNRATALNLSVENTLLGR